MQEIFNFALFMSFIGAGSATAFLGPVHLEILSSNKSLKEGSGLTELFKFFLMIFIPVFILAFAMRYFLGSPL